MTSNVGFFNGRLGIAKSDPKVAVYINTSDAIKLPSGFTSQRPAGLNVEPGMMRYNTTTGKFEGFSGDTGTEAWGSLGDGSGGGGGGGGTSSGATGDTTLQGQTLESVDPDMSGLMTNQTNVVGGGDFEVIGSGTHANLDIIAPNGSANLNLKVGTAASTAATIGWNDTVIDFNKPVNINGDLTLTGNVTGHTVTAQNYAVGGTNFISATRQGNFRDLEVKDSGNSATILLTGDGGHISIDGTLSTDTIGEKTSGSGVTIDSVLLKDNTVTAHTISAQNYAVGGTNFISASRQGNFRDLEVKDSGNSATILLTGDGGDISIDGTLSADKIGIGSHNSDAGYKLDVWGNARFMNTTYFENATYLQTSSIYINSYITHNGDPDTLFGFPDANTFKIQVNGSDRLYIKSNGNVGIGTTSPGSILEVYDNSAAGEVKDILHVKNSGGYDMVSLGTSSNFNSGAISLYQNSTTKATPSIVINSNGNTYFNGGNVGIGTTSPYARLEVTRTGSHSDSHIRIGDGNHNGAASPAIYPVLTYYARTNAVRRNTDPLFSGPGNTGGCTAAICFTDRPGTYTYASAVRTSDITFYTALSTIDNISLGQYPRERMRITAQGNVGIGTTDPAAPLHVDGATSIFSYAGDLQLKLRGGQSSSSDRDDCGISFANRYSIGNTNECWFIGSTESSSHETKFMICLDDGDDYNPDWDGNGKWMCSTSGTITNNRSWIGSDDRIKNNETNITNALDTINKLDVKGYFKSIKMHDYDHNYILDNSGIPIKDQSGNEVTKKDYDYEIGIIAQQVKTIPELAHAVHGEEYGERLKGKEEVYDESGNVMIDSHGNPIKKKVFKIGPTRIYLNYSDIFCYNIAATQELHKAQQADNAEIAELKTKNAALENKVSTLDNKVTTLESTLETVLARLTELENTPTDEVVV